MFKYDNPLMQYLTKIANIMLVNLMFIFTSIPIFTIGASLSAMQVIFYRVLHNEEVGVIKEYLVAFKENFKKSTLIWLIFMAVYMALGYNIIYLWGAVGSVDVVIHTFAIVLSVFVYAIMLYIFPLQSHYENTLLNTFKNAAIIAISHPFRTILMLVIQAFFAVISVVIFFDWRYIPLLICFSIALPWYFCSMIHMPIFDKFDGKDKNIIDEELKPISEFDDEELADMEAEKEAARMAKENAETTVTDETADDTEGK